MSVRLASSRVPMIGLLAYSGMARLADQMSAVVYGWSQLEQRGDSFGAALIMAASFAGLIIGTLFAGRLIGRFGARSTALAGVWVSVLAAAAIAALLHAGYADPFAIAALAAIGALLDGPAAIASETNYPEVARIARVDLVRLNAADDALDHTAGLVAPAAAAILVSSQGAPNAAIALAVLGLMAAVSLSASLPSFRPRGREAVTLGTVVAHIRSDAVLFPLVMLFSGGVAVLVAAQLVIVPRLIHDARLGADTFAVFLVGAGIGGVAGAGLAAFAQRLGLRLVLSMSFAVMAGALCLPLAGLAVWKLFAAGALIGLPVGVVAPIANGIFQTRPPKSMRADVQGVSGSLAFALAPLAILGTGVAIDVAPARWVIAGLAALMLLLAIAAYAALSKADHPAPPLKPLRAGGQGMVVSLARKSLIYDWRRYLAAVMAVAFSGLLVIVQIGLLLGLFRTVTLVVDRAGADLWIGDATIESFDLARDLPERVEFLVRSHPDAARVERLHMSSGDWRAPDGRRTAVMIFGVDATEASLGFPRSLSPSLREALRVPGTVVVDEVDLNKLGVVPGMRQGAEIDGRRVEVAGVMNGFRSIGGAMVFVSEPTFRDLRAGAGAGQPDGTAYFLVGLRPGSDPEVVKADLNRASPGVFKAMSAEELSVMSQSYWLLETGTGVGFLFSTVLGLLVGVAITSQTLRAAVLASLREYATLRALGIPLGALRAVVLEQSVWIGVVGLVLAGAITAGAWWFASMAEVALVLTWWALLGTGAFTLIVAIISGLFSLGPLLRTEPADLLR